MGAVVQIGDRTVSSDDLFKPKDIAAESLVNRVMAVVLPLIVVGALAIYPEISALAKLFIAPFAAGAAREIARNVSAAALSIFATVFGWATGASLGYSILRALMIGGAASSMLRT